MEVKGVWRIVPRPEGKKNLTARSLSDGKCNSNGSVKQYGARLVVRGFEQVKVVDFFDFYAPVRAYATLRVVMTMSAMSKFPVIHLDVVTSFLNAELEKEIFIEPPKDFGAYAMGKFYSSSNPYMV